ncbi:hypothetical protein ACFSKL_22365 [Belliella marina]|uniref:Uncharacterized protein n=1 Tax=Belliella marina TaxID=1644146 RepID=A0ABW4VVH6_9BACT
MKGIVIFRSTINTNFHQQSIRPLTGLTVPLASFCMGRGIWHTGELKIVDYTRQNSIKN